MDEPTHAGAPAAVPTADPRLVLRDAVEGVGGWLWPREAWELHEAARVGVARGRDPVAVEIGSWKGRSTIAIGLGLKARGGGTVHAIDPHEAADDRNAEMLANLERAGVLDVVHSVRAYSHDARTAFSEPVDLLFVDGSHEYADVMRDIRDWTPLLSEGAIVAFNDPMLPGVNRALLEEIVRPGGPYREPRFVVNTVFFRFVPGPPSGRDRREAKRLRAMLRFAGIWLPFHQRVCANRFVPVWFRRAQATAAAAIMHRLFPAILAKGDLPGAGA